MPNISKPNKLNLLWASGGDILDPGDTKYQTGWGVEVPPRQWENYIQNKQDQAIAHINQHGIAVWDAETEYQADTSYTQGATNGTIYRAKVTHSGQNPELDALNTYWDIAFASAGDFYTKAEVDADFLAKDQNFADLDNVVTARTNLNVYSKTETYTKTEVDGKTTVASTAQAQAWVSNNTLVTPLRLAEAFGGSNQTLAGNGYQKLPGGLILQWGLLAGSPGVRNIVFPISFNTSVFQILLTANASQTYAGEFGDQWVNSLSLTGSTIFCEQDQTIRWMALGS
jgi:hypothetical protein